VEPPALDAVIHRSRVERTPIGIEWNREVLSRTTRTPIESVRKRLEKSVADAPGLPVVREMLR